MKSLPEEFLNEMKDLLGPEFPAFTESYDKPRLYGLRVNTEKISVEEFLRISPFRLRPIPWCRSGFYYSEEDRPAKHPYYYAGLYYLQEPSAMLPAESLPVSGRDLVLDACAAPGGKSTAIMNKNPALLVTNDIISSRAQALLRNMEGFGGTDYLLLNDDPAKFTDRFQDTFDKIILDAPCSGEGMFRKEPRCIDAWVEHGHDYYVKIQKSLIKNCYLMLKEGGKMIYSTCTFSIKEDEEVISYLKSLFDNVRILKIDTPCDCFSSGIPDGMGLISPEELKNIIRIFPHKSDGEGHFVVLIQKGEAPAHAPLRVETVKIDEIRGFSGLEKETREFLSKLKKTLKPGKFEVRGEHLSYVPDLPLELRGLHIIRAGLYLGDAKKNRFEPSQSLAMALKRGEYPEEISFPADDENVIRYLKGETLILDEEPDIKDGYVLVMTDGYPLGFAKKKGTTLKNHYLSGWRMTT